MPFVIVTSDDFADHLTPPGHPESPERAEILAGVAQRARERGVAVVEPREASDAELTRVHTWSHVAAIEATRGRSVMIDDDTFTSPDTGRIARLAAGAAVLGVEQGSDALVLVRPPGHHAEPGQAMGFCFYNNVAIAAAAARAAGAARVAIVDIDVHHGNGTERDLLRRPLGAVHLDAPVAALSGNRRGRRHRERRRPRASPSTSRSKPAPPTATTWRSSTPSSRPSLRTTRRSS